ncbi:type IV toxin-antitoxin system AbiEi family antitoxin domain-containing protein [Pelagibacterium luteolum]|uniref:Transcriptional regulator, AbiEi antitoxin, Type IV TA system n=1 Tax=Pelagibacterium luteolum TaxID=440168 RepID=A0A1G7Y2X2_9HYPH|nr:type IV toxin-antitoxin system AbiEi family antitoxin domain-containing protein [Pelagibacterium luteolum]SDG90606.1 Transcriptional regulator, AbiEi antitoxin, Type IV TA system [Pelagibacterium luteolum]
MPTNADRRKTLFELVPEGMPVTRAWLAGQDSGFDRHGVDNLVKSGLLVSVAPGVYTRPATRLTWQGLVSALQNVLRSDLTVGGLSALELHGFAHYLPLSSRRTIHLYGKDNLPKWLNTVVRDTQFVRHLPLPGLGSTGLINQEYDTAGGSFHAFEDPGPYEGRWPFTMSSPERAFLELLADIPGGISFAHADELLQGMTSLSPRRLTALLEKCQSVKVRRLFYWLTERHTHAWAKKLPPPDNLDELGLGSGKRELAKGGKLDAKYLITVPEDMWTPPTRTTGA